MATGRQRPRAVTTCGGGAIILAMLIVNGAGLCVTDGIPEVGDRIFSGF